MRTLFIAGVTAMAAAVAITLLWKPAPIEERLIELQVARLLPAYAAELSREPLELQAQFIDYAQHGDPVLGAKARLALLRYPEMARPILALYGAEPLFQDVLREHGEQVIAPIHYFLTHEIRSVSLRKRASDYLGSAAAGARQLWGADQAAGTPPAAEGSSAVSPEERGWYAVMFIRREGHNFLGQFVVGDDGQVSWVQTERVLEAANAFFAGGLRGLETKYRRNEALEWGDVGWAAVDVAVVGSALKILRMGRSAGGAARTMSFSERSAALGASLLRGSALGLRVAKYGAPAALAYIALRHPSVLNSIFRWQAERLGLPVSLMQALGWTLVLLPVALLLQVLLRPLALVLTGLARGLKWSDAMMRGRARA